MPQFVTPGAPGELQTRKPQTPGCKAQVPRQLEFAVRSPHLWRMKLNWRRPLFYLVLPILVFLAFVGFPPPFPPVRPVRPEQTQGEEVDEKA